MTRRFATFTAAIAAMAGAVAAQEPIVITPGETRIGPPYKRNGECPVCGTQARPFTQLPCYESRPDGSPVEVACAPRLVRCAKCSAAYWQDPER